MYARTQQARVKKANGFIFAERDGKSCDIDSSQHTDSKSDLAYGFVSASPNSCTNPVIYIVNHDKRAPDWVSIYPIKKNSIIIDSLENIRYRHEIGL
ncbi:Piso0_000411 [Millerozyma farinosa CBS 7064]|uniref:Piso0_000411 protein n=1 Tax=Pichia sorbitophila (strain ATCC MYA-4447 / BCRC 22081 / CBS 7064 / NBRC 10061 / NRRL Y-12695) TaxID=559304 RepID=G8YVD4_PICSO|nr:Piso0_000411 [Millerozyma farinosa CBS 7064]CCE73378.1 Piso0_000411 [Millerozyma farinosa CBS 7064]